MADYDALIGDVAAAFSEHDFSRLRAWLHDDAIFDWSRARADNRGLHEGLDAIEAAFERFLEPWASANWQVTDPTELAPGRLLVTTRVLVRGRDSGIEVSGTGAQVWELRDEKVARVTLFQSRQDAEAAVAEGIV